MLLRLPKKGICPTNLQKIGIPSPSWRGCDQQKAEHRREAADWDRRVTRERQLHGLALKATRVNM